MNKKFLKVTVLFVSVAIIFSACKKDEDPTPPNPTPGNTLNGKTTAVFNNSISYGTMTDQDGNIYKTVTIGTQTWMAENLRTTKYNDGTPIPNVIDPTAWKNLSTGAYCNYNNTTSDDTIATYGRLYNWFAVNTGELAPTGWHVPGDAEWLILVNYLVGPSGAKLKEAGTTHWASPNTGATNETGFTALPGGWRTDNGTFTSIGGYGLWWCATEYDSFEAWQRSMGCNYSDVYIYYNNKKAGYSVRCVKN